MTQTPPAEDHAALLLAHLLHKAGQPDKTSTPGITGGSTIDPLGQSIIDRAMNKSSGSATTGDTVNISAPTPAAAPGGETTSAPFAGDYPHTGEFGEVRDNGAVHGGIDFGVPMNTPLYTTVPGTVTISSDDGGGFGTHVEYRTDDGTILIYGHMSSTSVNVGDHVRAGQTLGVSGNTGHTTGPHLHFEARRNGQSIDPTPWLAGGHPIAGASPSEITSTTTTSTTAIDPESAQAANLVDIAAGRHPTDSGETKTTSETKQTVKEGQAGTPGASGDSDPAAIDTFLTAIRGHESGGGVMGNADYHVYNQSGLSNASGAYQFIGTTWRGQGGTTQNTADASPEEQDRVARKMATDLFNQYHSWRLVAIAWYSPAAAEVAARGGDPGHPDQQGGYLAYGDAIRRMMTGGGA